MLLHTPWCYSDELSSVGRILNLSILEKRQTEQNTPILDIYPLADQYYMKN